MEQANLNNESVSVDDGLDSIVIVKDLGDIPGGRTLDVSSLSADVKVVKSGHIIVKDADGNCKPLGVSNGNYITDTTGLTFVGVLKASVLKSRPMAAILTIGQVNAAASPYKVTAAIKTAFPRIEFIND